MLGIQFAVSRLNEEDPSQRIRMLNLSEGIRLFEGSSYWSDVVSIHHPFSMHGTPSFIVFNESSPEMHDYIRRMRESNFVRIVFDYNEFIHLIPGIGELVQESFKLADVITCCSTLLAKSVEDLGYAASVVYDAIEDVYEAPRDKSGRDRPVAMYVGMGGNSWLVTSYLRKAIENAGYDLCVVSEWNSADYKWSLDTWQSLMAQADVVLCPQRVINQPHKSANKVTQALAIGIPVVASKLHAYQEVIEDGVNGYLCDTPEEWESALIQIKRKKFVPSKLAYSVRDYYRLNVVKQFIDAIKQSTKKEGHVVPTIEPVSIIIPVYNGLEYLKLCLDSIALNTDYPYEVILSDAGSTSDVWDFLDVLNGYTILGNRDTRLNFSQACNAGILASTREFFVVLNSDVIVSPGWLSPLVKAMRCGERVAACGVLSNCDVGWMHGPGLAENYNMTLPSGLTLHPGMKYESIANNLSELYGFMSRSNIEHADKLVDRGWVAAYATMFARSAVNEVGLFDPIFINGCEDLDLCNRFIKSGYVVKQAISSFVYHFGGISRGAYQNENFENYLKEDNHNHETYSRKWNDPVIAVIGRVQLEKLELPEYQKVLNFKDKSEYIKWSQYNFADVLYVPTDMVIDFWSRAAEIKTYHEHKMMYGYFHIAIINGVDSMMVAAEMHGRIMQSGMYAASEKITVTILGDRAYADLLDQSIFRNYPKYQVLLKSPFLDSYEFPTLRYMKSDADKLDNSIFWYVHTKGVSNCRPDVPEYIQANIRRWRNALSLFLDPLAITQDLANNAPTATGPLRSKDGTHYVGNFFAFNTSFGRSLPDVGTLDLSNRNNAETWVGLSPEGILLSDTTCPRDDLYGFNEIGINTFVGEKGDF